jgi:predicted nucleotidyltransferase component of viral defense system
MESPQPKIPAHLDPLAKEMLDRLRAHPEAARHVILGGYFALKHYLDYRNTADIDGWWSSDTAPNDQRLVLECLRSIAHEIAGRHGLTVKERVSSTSDVASIEFQRDGRAIFSFQIAARAIELTPPLTDKSPWSPIPIETLEENIASKMNALVSRGAPRDFQDIRRLVEEHIIAIDDAWSLWQAKNPGNDDLAEAKQQVMRRMHAIELRRPLESIPADERAAAAKARCWVYQELTHQTSDDENGR